MLGNWGNVISKLKKFEGEGVKPGAMRTVNATNLYTSFFCKNIYLIDIETCKRFSQPHSRECGSCGSMIMTVISTFLVILRYRP